jgi:hypothetical protein
LETRHYKVRHSLTLSLALLPLDTFFPALFHIIYTLLSLCPSLSLPLSLYRNVVMQADPDLTRTVLVTTKLDTKLPQFSEGDDLEDFLRYVVVCTCGVGQWGVCVYVCMCVRWFISLKLSVLHYLLCSTRFYCLS